MHPKQTDGQTNLIPAITIGEVISNVHWRQQLLYNDEWQWHLKQQQHVRALTHTQRGAQSLQTQHSCTVHCAVAQCTAVPAVTHTQCGAQSLQTQHSCTVHCAVAQCTAVPAVTHTQCSAQSLQTQHSCTVHCAVAQCTAVPAVTHTQRGAQLLQTQHSCTVHCAVAQYTVPAVTHTQRGAQSLQTQHSCTVHCAGQWCITNIIAQSIRKRRASNQLQLYTFDTSVNICFHYNILTNCRSDGSLWRTLRPSAGQAQQWVSECLIYKYSVCVGVQKRNASTALLHTCCRQTI